MFEQVGCARTERSEQGPEKGWLFQIRTDQEGSR